MAPRLGGSLPTHPPVPQAVGPCAKVEWHRRFLPRLAVGQSPAQHWRSSHVLGRGQEIVPALHSPRALKGENREGEEGRRQRVL